MNIFVSYMVGVIFGSVATTVIFMLKRAHGVLRIDHSDPEKVRCRFEVGDIDSLFNKSEIILRIDNNADLSQR